MRDDVTSPIGFDSPQLHEKCYLPGEMPGVDGGIVPPSNTTVDQEEAGGSAR